MTLEQLESMSSAEFEVWREYHKRHGFEVDRIVWAVAIAGAAIVRAWGGTRQARDNVPVFWRPAMTREERKKLIAALSALPGAKVEFIPKDKIDGSGQRHSVG